MRKDQVGHPDQPLFYHFSATPAVDARHLARFSGIQKVRPAAVLRTVPTRPECLGPRYSNSRAQVRRRSSTLTAGSFRLWFPGDCATIVPNSRLCRAFGPVLRRLTHWHTASYSQKVAVSGHYLVAIVTHSVEVASTKPERFPNQNSGPASLDYP